MCIQKITLHTLSQSILIYLQDSNEKFGIMVHVNVEKKLEIQNKKKKDS